MTPDDILARHRPFDALAAADRADLAADTALAGWPAGPVDLPPGRLGLILDGSGVTTWPLDGQPVAVDLVAAGDGVGWGRVLSDAPDPLGLHARTAMTLALLPVAGLRGRLAGPWGVRLAGHLSARLHRLLDQLGDLRLAGAVERLARFLCDIAPPGPDPVTFDLPGDRATLAHRLGMSRETLSRALGRLDPAAVTIAGRRVTLIDRGALLATDPDRPPGLCR